MNKENYFNYLKQNYESLKDFSFDSNENKLIYSKYKIRLKNIDLFALDFKLFNNTPDVIFNVIYLLELAPYISDILDKEDNEDNHSYIDNYIDTYIFINDLAVQNNSLPNDVIYKINYPIQKMFLDKYKDSYALKRFNEKMDEHNGKSRGQRLVLVNPNFEMVKENSPIDDIAKAGFASILLIAGAIVITCVYVALVLYN